MYTLSCVDGCLRNGSDLDIGEHYSQSGMTGINYYFLNQIFLFFKNFGCHISCFYGTGLG